MFIFNIVTFDHYWPLHLSVLQWALAQPSGRSQFSRGLWFERKDLTSPSGVMWPATRKEWNKTLSGPCTCTQLPIERSVSWAHPSTTTPMPCTPSVSTARKSTSRGWAETLSCCTSPSYRPPTRACTSATPQTLTAATWASTAPVPTSPVSLLQTVT